jgi:hypothetical protein
MMLGTTNIKLVAMSLSVVTVCADAIRSIIFADAKFNGINVPSTTVSFKLMEFFSYV